MKEMILLNLSRFDGAAGASGGASAGAAEGTGNMGESAAAATQIEPGVKRGRRVAALDVERLRNPQPQSAEQNASQGATVPDGNAQNDVQNPPAEDKAKRWQGLINGEFAEEYRNSTSDIIRKRLAESDQRMTDMQTRLDSQSKTMNMLRTMLGVDEGADDDALYNTLANTTELWEEAAARNGMDTQDYMRMMQTEMAYRSEKARADALEEERTQREVNRQRQEQETRQFQDWMRQADNLKQTYPDFDLVNELKTNETFQRMLHVARLPVKDAYEFAHRGEIEQAKIDAVRQQMATNIANRNARPSENGTYQRSMSNSTVVKKNPRDMTKAERQALGKRAMLGEHVTF